MDMSRVAIVTGANGWLGSQLVTLLVNGYSEHPELKESQFDEIRCLILPGSDRTKLNKFGEKVKIFEGDIRNKESIKSLFESVFAPTIFHTAGIIHPKQVKEFFEINLEGTKNITSLAIENKAKRMVIVSSNSPIGCNPSNDHLFDENSPYNPYMGYGKSKKQMEDFLLTQTDELDLKIIRCPWFYGPNQPERQTLFFKMVRTGKMPIVGSGNNKRSMSYIDNLCQGLLLAGIKDSPSTIYWIADKNPYTMNEIISTIKDLQKNDFKMDVSSKNFKLPFIVGQVAELIDGALQSVGLYHQKFHVLSEMNKTIACSVEKAMNELDYRPQIALKEGMRRSISWCLDQGHQI